MAATTTTWPLKRLKDITSKIGSGATPRGGKNGYRAEGISLIRSLNVYDFSFTEEDLAFIGDEQAAELDNVIVQKDDILLNITGASVARCCLTNPKFLPARVNQHVAIVRVRPEVADARFVLYCINSLHFKSRLLALAQGGATREALTKTTIEDFEVCQPPLPVQRRIAGILSAYDELMENSQQRIRLLEAMARALYREWFVNFRFPGHEKHPRVASPLGDIPQGWEVKPFTEIADVLSGGTPKTDVAEYWDGEIPFFTPRDVPDCFYVQDTDKHTNELGLSKCASELYPPDTVFITARGTVGKVALPSVPMAMNQSCYALRGKPGIPQRFLFLMTLQQVDYLKTNTGGATFDTIVVDTFRRMEVVKATRDIVARFAKKTDGIFEQVNTLQRQIQNLRRTRDLLLPRLLLGQVKLKTEVA
jgi:type I restriction enzyme S subunit